MAYHATVTSLVLPLLLLIGASNRIAIRFGDGLPRLVLDLLTILSCFVYFMS